MPWYGISQILGQGVSRCQGVWRCVVKVCQAVSGCQVFCLSGVLSANCSILSFNISLSLSFKLKTLSFSLSRPLRIPPLTSHPSLSLSFSPHPSLSLPLTLPHPSLSLSSFPLCHILSLIPSPKLTVSRQGKERLRESRPVLYSFISAPHALGFNLQLLGQIEVK